MNRAVIAFGTFTFVLWAASPGIRPRADASSYPSHQNQQDFSIGAALIPPDLAKKVFKLDMNHAGYVVVEVGVFPAPGKDLDLYPTDFTLYAGDDKIAALRPVSSDTIAERLEGNQDPPRIRDPLGLHPWASVAKGHGTTGGATDAEAGVSVGDPASPPASQPSPAQKANLVAQDLWEKSLPDGRTPHAVAGYLYFPKPSRKEKNKWELRYENADGVLHFSSSQPLENQIPAGTGNGAAAQQPDATFKRLQDMAGGIRQLQTITDNALDTSNALFAHAHALRVLAHEFPPKVESELPAANAATLLTLRQRQVGAMTYALRQLREQLKPLLVENTNASGDNETVANWQTGAESLYEATRNLDQQVSRLLSGSYPDQAGEQMLKQLPVELSRTEALLRTQ